jgi:DDE superfamily endonuclease
VFFSTLVKQRNGRSQKLRYHRVTDGLYLNPPVHAAAFCADEKSAIQALDRLDPVLPLSPSRAGRHGFEYYRHGTLSLYAALNTQTGEVLAETSARHTSAEFVDFLAQIVASQPPGREIHVVVDILSAHKTKRVSEFLEANPTVRIHYTQPTPAGSTRWKIGFPRFSAKLFVEVSSLPLRISRASRCATFATITKPLRPSAGSTKMSLTESLLLLYESQT